MLLNLFSDNNFKIQGYNENTGIFDGMRHTSTWH